LDLDLAALAERANLFFSAEPRPFIKWAGSKRFLLPDIVPLLPTSFRTYHEPFFGAGALFFLIQPNVAYLADACSELISTYLEVAEHPNEILEKLRNWPTNSRVYYQLRDKVSSETTIDAAARFIYLNRNCWNGLYRVNLTGKFNVPYGRPKTANKLNEANFAACATALSKTRIHLAAADFEVSLKRVRAHDLVFLDPPYVTQHSNNGFREYNERIFSWSDQVRLAGAAQKLVDRGAYVIVTNAYHSDIADLYPRFRLVKVERASTIASNKERRGRATEAILYCDGGRNQ
jgi:DNA adenine methylase